MSKTFKLIEPGHTEEPQSASAQPATATDWTLCFIYQETTAESLTDPSQNQREIKGSIYSTFIENLNRFNELGLLPKSFLLDRLDEGSGAEAALSTNNARYHKTCKLRYNKTKLHRAEKRHLAIGVDEEEKVASRKRTRSLSCSSSTETKPEECFFCGEAPGTAGLHEAATFQLDSRVRSCALIVDDMELLTKLNAGDMVAQEAKYHRNCLLNLYNRARKTREMAGKGADNERTIAGLAFAELVMFIEDAHVDDEVAPVFKLADLVQLYTARMEQLGVKLDSRVHSTRLKERVLAHFPNMRAERRGRDVLLAFTDDFGDALAKPCELDSDIDAVHLARAAQIVRRHIIGDSVFSGFPAGCQQDSVPPTQ